MASTATREQVENWIREEGYETSDVKVESAGGGTAPSWSLGLKYRPSVASKDQALANMVIISDDARGRIDIIMPILLSDEHRGVMNGDSTAARWARRTLREKLLPLPRIGFAWENKESQTVGIRIDALLFIDAPATKDLLIGTIRSIYTSYLLIVDILNQAANPGGHGFNAP